MEKTWKPVVAGILNIVAGAIHLIGFIGVIIAIFAIGSGIPLWQYAPETFPTAIGLAQTILIIVAVFTAIVGILPLVGGIYSVQRKKWGLAFAGSIAAIFGTAVLGLLAVIFTAMSRDEFES
ncbi:hypothetical protein ACFLUE_02360 [Chloroflexota bacterium]